MREQIHQEGEARFTIFEGKREVLVKNLKELYTLSEYLDFNLLEYFQDYNPFEKYTTDFEMIISCKYKQSVTESHQGDMSADFAEMFTGIDKNSAWATRCRQALPLKIFMNPDKEDYSEYFI